MGEDLDSLQVKSELDIRLPEFHSGESENVVAVFLSLATDPPADVSDQIEVVLDDISAGDLEQHLVAAPEE